MQQETEINTKRIMYRINRWLHGEWKNDKGLDLSDEARELLSETLIHTVYAYETRADFPLELWELIACGLAEYHYISGQDRFNHDEEIIPHYAIVPTPVGFVAGEFYYAQKNAAESGQEAFDE